MGNPILDKKNRMGMVQNPQMGQVQRSPVQRSNGNEYQQALDYIRQSGLSPMRAFFKAAQEMGVDPNSFMTQNLANIQNPFK